MNNQVPNTDPSLSQMCKCGHEYECHFELGCACEIERDFTCECRKFRRKDDAIIEVLTECIELMDKLARKNFPQLGITDARYEPCFRAILLRNKLKSLGEK